ncbi:MAG: carbohydrate kinase family protein [Parcubacteria group bacterium]|nr:carbohydrate kinase family protein [Parcubacteria group bacterium]
MPDNFDFIAIGDTVTDAFIRIKQASVYYDDHDHESKLCLTNGAKIPYESVTIVPAVGNSANAAVSAARLGLRSALVTDMGADDHGKENLEALTKNNVATDFIRTHEGQLSNYHYVLWHKAERTILIKHETYDYKLPDVGAPKWLYFSSVGENSLPYHMEIAEYAKTHPDVKLAFQPGTFQIKLGVEKLKVLYQHAEAFFCNVEEAQMILNTHEADVPTLARNMSGLGPKIAIITDGPKGAYVHRDGQVWFMPPYPDPAPPFERTGAGDAFASTFTAALALGKSIEEALLWAPINSMSVVQKIGAQAGLLTVAEIEEWLAKAPAEYKPRLV